MAAPANASVAIIGTRGYPSYYGGFETAVRHLAPYLADAGWDVTVYGRRGATRSEDKARDVRVRSVETWGVELKSLSTLSYGLTAVLHAMFARPSVAIIMNVANGFWIPLLKLARIPTLVNVDGIEWERAKWGPLARRMFYWGARLTAKFGTTMVYDSKEIARRWREEFQLDGVFIPYGADDFDGPIALPEQLQKRRFVLFVARFVGENSVQEFFDAVPELAKTADVVIVGSTGYGGDFDEQARLLDLIDGVHWLGHVNDDSLLFSLWQASAAYFHGHSVGGTNPALVQAMALGAPIVARDTPYNREVLGATGHFVDPDSSSIISGVNEMLSDKAVSEKASADGSARARQFYTWDGVNGAYARAASSLARLRGPRLAPPTEHLS